MGKIRQMPESLSNQIAAGEVVERPASVVKELVENAIDAGASQILIELEEAGIQSIVVNDDGVGMDLDDLRLSIAPHATSKVYDLHDLFQIQSLGFRGEALASIASVSRTTLTSKTAGDKEEKGHYILVEGSKILEEGLSPSNQGTTIKVENLFYNTPARLKHLASLKTELRHSLHFIQEISLAYPHIRFTLMSDGNKIFSTYGRGDLRQAIASIYQPSLARQLIKIEGQDDDFHIQGFISPPQLTRTSRSHLHWLINGRVIQSYILSQVLLKAYGRQLMIGRYPIGIISIQLDPQLVDVNVHPTKQTVRLSKEDELAQLLTQVVQRALNKINPIPKMEVDTLNLEEASPPPQLSTVKREEDKPSSLKLEQNLGKVNPSSLFEQGSPYGLKEGVSHSSESESKKNEQGDTVVQVVSSPDSWKEVLDSNKNQGENISQEVFQEDLNPSENQEEASKKERLKLEQTRLEPEEAQDVSLIQTNSAYHLEFAQLRYVGQIHGTYLIAESETGFYLIDQHAAQERIRYEAFMRDDNKDMSLQQVLMPFVFDFSPSESILVQELASPLQKLGIFLDPIGPNSYQMEAYPYWMEVDEVDKSIHDLLVILDETPTISISQLKEKALIMKACRGAIKANHHLSEQQAKTLIEDLAYLDDPYHCPHGRPVLVEFNQKSLEKLFKRIQDSHQSGHQII